MTDVQLLSPELRLREDGIWYGPESQGVSYPLQGNVACFAVEDDSFWFKHRNDCILSIVERFPPDAHGAIVDIGGGNGFVSKLLEQAGFEVVLIEPGSAGVANAKNRGLRNVICATTDTAKISPGVLPAVGLFDVIEHIEDDVTFLRSIHTMMKPAGRLYATVPAYSCLWSAEDVIAGHSRRYCATTLRERLEVAGFEVEFCSYIFRPLLLPIFLLRALPYRLGLTGSGSANESRSHAAGGGVINRVLCALLRPELGHLRNGRSMRFGGSCLVVAKAL